MDKLHPFLPLQGDETHLSWVSRLAAFHASTTAAVFLQDLGLTPRLFASGDEQQVRLLCEIAGEDPTRVLAQTIQGAAAATKLRGTALGDCVLPRATSRFCPACLLKDEMESDLPPNAARRMRLIWRFRFTTHCPLHRLPLIERTAASEGSIEGIAEVVEQDADGLKLLAEASVVADPSPLQDYLVARLTTATAGHWWLDVRTVGTIYALADRLGAYLRSEVREEGSEVAQDDPDLGWMFLRDGPVGFRRALQPVTERRRPKNSHRALFGSFEAVRQRHGLRFVDAIIDDLSVAPRHRARMIAKRELSLVHTIDSLSREVGVASDRLMPALIAAGLLPSWADGIDEFDFGARRPVSALEMPMEASLQVAALVSDGLPVGRLAKILNADVKIVDALVDDRLAMLETHRIPNKVFPPCVSKSAVSDLLALIEKLDALDEEEGRLSLLVAAKITGESVPTLLDIAIGGACSGVVTRLKGEIGFGALRLELSAVPKLLGADKLRSLSLEEVGERMGLTEQAAAFLVSASSGGLLPHSRNEMRIRPADWRAFRARYATPAMIGEEIGCRATAVAERLDLLGIPPITPLLEHGVSLFSRSSLAGYLPRSIP
ncbi:TniQ family protein [Frigidibacter sp. MR17.14]|uniref:TniQ family protein n=1 Tax=Frigidibacter sp. MR17.14 TaxID=3126509 RepID=UPI003012E1E6